MTNPTSVVQPFAWKIALVQSAASNMLRYRCIFFFCLSANLVLAQSGWGIRLGYGGMDISGTPGRETAVAGSPSIGLFKEFSLAGSKWSLGTGMEYRSAGFRHSNLQAVDQSGFNLGLIALHRIHYLQSPLSLGYRFPAGRIKWLVSFGGYLARTLGDRLQVQGGDRFGNETAFPSGTSGIRDWSAGYRLQLAFCFTRLKLGMEYQRSLTDIYLPEISAAEWKAAQAGLWLQWTLN